MGQRWADERLLAIAEAIAPITGGFQPPPAYRESNPA
jgi:Asp-tRNA(Asn)/Glu-tRNA(Gln) amidotransferase A subunit family amidase